MDKLTLNAIGERVDHLITLDVRGRGKKCPVMEKLYPAAREIVGGPITTYAATSLVETLRPGDTVFLVTGMACYGMALETDGPLGALALARAIQIGLGVRPILLTHRMFAAQLKAVAASAGFFAVERDQIKQAWRRLPSALLVEGLSTEENEASDKIRLLVDEFAPKAVVAIEARGANKDGEYHVVDGTNITAMEAKFTSLFNWAKKKNTLTIGIFDGCGHEIGFGTIANAVKEEYPRYSECSCECPSGMHDATIVDIALPCAVSNWGAYGIEACLSALIGNINVLHNIALESRMLRACADAGAIDGLTGRSEFSVDGLPENIQLSIIAILHEIVEGTRKVYDPHLEPEHQS